MVANEKRTVFKEKLAGGQCGWKDAICLIFNHWMAQLPMAEC